MHICFITDHYPKPGEAIGGIGILVQTLGRALVRQGVRVTVVGAGYKTGSTDQDEGVTVVRIPRSRWPVLKFVQQVGAINRHLRRIHRQHPIHIIECSEVGLALIYKLKGVRFVIRMHGGHRFFRRAENLPLVRKTAWQEKRSFLKADALVGVSHFVTRQTAALLHFNPAIATIIFNGVNTIPPEAYTGPVHPYEILFAGTLCEKKGVRQLVIAFAEVLEAVPQARLVLLGKPVHGPAGDVFMQLLHKEITPETKPCITFTGSVPHHKVFEQISTAHVCAYPSHMEALPMVWLETMALGKPIIGACNGPGPEMIIHEQNGLLCNPHSPADIARQLIRMLQDDALAGRCGQMARQTIATRFNMDIIVQQNITFYRNTIGKWNA